MDSPPDFNNSSKPAMDRKVTKTPAENDNPCWIIFSFDPSLCSTKFNIFIERIGKTQGMAFKIKPPIKAKITVRTKSLMDSDSCF